MTLIHCAASKQCSTATRRANGVAGSLILKALVRGLDRRTLRGLFYATVDIVYLARIVRRGQRFAKTVWLSVIYAMRPLEVRYDTER